MIPKPVCEAHPRYKARRRPRSTPRDPDGCRECWSAWCWAKTLDVAEVRPC